MTAGGALADRAYTLQLFVPSVATVAIERQAEGCQLH